MEENREKVDILISRLEKTVSEFTSRPKVENVSEWVKHFYSVAKIVTVSRGVYFLLALKNHKSSDEAIARLRININSEIVKTNNYVRKYACDMYDGNEPGKKEKRAYYMQFVLPEITDIPVCFSNMQDFVVYLESRNSYVEKILWLLDSDELNMDLIHPQKPERFISNILEDFHLKYYMIYFNEENIGMETSQNIFDALIISSRVIIGYFALLCLNTTGSKDVAELQTPIKADIDTAINYRNVCLKLLHRCFATNNSFMGGCLSLDEFIRHAVHF